MIRVVRTIALVLVVAVLGVAGILAYVGTRPAVPVDYQTTTETGGTIEATCL